MSEAIYVGGLVITWILFAIAIRNFKTSEEKRKRDEAGHLEEVILRVCKAFVSSDDYVVRWEKQMIATAQRVVDEAFRVRAPSFVDAGENDKRHEESNRRITTLENAVIDIRKDFYSAAGKIAAEVTVNMARLLKG